MPEIPNSSRLFSVSSGTPALRRYSRPAGSLNRRLDPVGSETVLQQRRALQRLADAQLRLRIQILDAVAGRHGAGGTGGEDRAEELVALAFDLFKRLGNCVAGHVVMPHVIAHFGKLVEDDAVGFLLQFVGLVEDFLHI